METKARIRVVAAVIERAGKILIGKRLEKGPRSGKWEFPGGKVREGEDDRDALRREVAEELGIEIDVGEKMEELDHDYPDLSVQVIFYRCRFAGNKKLFCRDHSSLAWVPPDKLLTYDFLEADG